MTSPTATFPVTSKAPFSPPGIFTNFLIRIPVGCTIGENSAPNPNVLPPGTVALMEYSTHFSPSLLLSLSINRSFMARLISVVLCWTVLSPLTNLSMACKDNTSPVSERAWFFMYFWAVAVRGSQSKLSALTFPSSCFFNCCTTRSSSKARCSSFLFFPLFLFCITTMTNRLPN